MRTQRGQVNIAVILVVGLAIGVAAVMKARLTRVEADHADVGVHRGSLPIMRQALELCRYEHGGFPRDAQEFVLRMTSTVNGHGPYLAKITSPRFLERLEGRTGVAVTSESPPTSENPDPDVAWLYNPTTGEIFLNAAGYFSQ